MFLHSLWVIRSVFPSIMLGTALLLAGTGLGWAMGRAPSLPPVRLIAWWVRIVVKPLVRCRGWGRRAAAIFLNNASILATVVAIGHWSTAAWLCVTGLGVSLGIGLRVLGAGDTLAAEELVAPVTAPQSGLAAPPCGRAKEGSDRRLRLGILLNLLEPPAIMLAVGLSLGRHAASIPSPRIWETFALWVVPLTLVAAGGEALWLGVCRATRNGRSTPASPRTNP